MVARLASAVTGYSRQRYARPLRTLVFAEPFLPPFQNCADACLTLSVVIQCIPHLRGQDTRIDRSPEKSSGQTRTGAVFELAREEATGMSSAKKRQKGGAGSSRGSRRPRPARREKKLASHRQAEADAARLSELLDKCESIVSQGFTPISVEPAAQAYEYELSDYYQARKILRAHGRMR